MADAFESFQLIICRDMPLACMSIKSISFNMPKACPYKCRSFGYQP